MPRKGDDGSDNGSDDSFDYDRLPVKVKRTVQGILGIEAQQREISKDFYREIFALERKYTAKYQQLFDRRKSIIDGVSSVTSSEVMRGEEASKEEDEDYKKLPPSKGSIPAVKIEDFWLQVLRSHPGFFLTIHESDEEALRFLSNITVAYPNVGRGQAFRVDFHFKNNKFFENKFLSKTYVYSDELSFYGGFMASHVIGDKIQWKRNQNLIKKAKDEDEDDEGDITPSFFCYFVPPEPLTKPSRQGKDGMSSEEAEMFEEVLDLDFDLGEALKDRIILRAGDYYTGVGRDYEDGDLDDDDDDDNDEDEENDDEDEDEDSD